MTLGEFIEKADGSRMVNVYKTYSKNHSMYGGFICTISKWSPICKLFSEKEVIAFGVTDNSVLNVAIETGDE